MNRNGNFTTGFGNKGIKPGDSVFNSKRGDNLYGTKTVNNNFKPNIGGMNRNYDPNELDSANDSLKLLKMKMGVGQGTQNTVVPSVGYNVNNLNSTYGTKSYSNNFSNNNFTPNIPNTNSSNYRKPFKPSFGSDNNMEPQIEINKGSSTIKNYSNTKPAVSNTKGKTTQNNNVKSRSNGNNFTSDNYDYPKSNNMNYQYSEVNPELERPIETKKIDFAKVQVDDDGQDMELITCNICGRNFRDEIIAKHSAACKKLATKKRKPFDLQKMRIVSHEQEMLLKRKDKEDKTKGKFGAKTNTVSTLNNGKPKAAKWKKQSEEFRAILRANRPTGNYNQPTSSSTSNKKGNYGNKAVPQKMVYNTPSVITEDYTHCELCDRRYNEQAYDKHLPTCERKAKESMFKMNKNTKPSIGNKPNLNVRFNKK